MVFNGIVKVSHEENSNSETLPSTFRVVLNESGFSVFKSFAASQV